MKSRKRISKARAAARRRMLILVGSCLVVIVGAVLLMNLETPPRVTRPDHSAIATAERPPLAVAVMNSSEANAPVVVGATTITPADVNALTVKKLLIPVAGVGAGELHDTFNDSRSEGRVHQALDIRAPQDTPVLAADDGKVMKLHQSGRGGTMLYQSDPSGTFVYYYGHLSRYADGIVEGREVKRGEVIAYVGDTGNAGPGNYHLHFGISKMSAPGKWSGGEPINPYPLLADHPSTASIRAR